MRLKLAIIVISAAISLLLMDIKVGTVKQRHDLVKSFIGDLDDVVVRSGLITDKKLHEIGAFLGICSPVPGDLK